MKKLLVATFTMAMMSGAHAVIELPASSAKAGQALAQNVCAACHNADGNSTITANPRLAGQNAKYIFKQLTEFKSGKRVNPIMQPQVANLTTQQMANVAAYFSAQKPLVDLSDDTAMAAGEKISDFVAGEKIYRGGDSARGIVPCAGCHGPAGKGNKFAAFPKIGGQHADYIKTQLTAFRTAGRKDLSGAVARNNDSAKANELGMMQTVASKLSDQDIANLANFLSGLH